MHGLPPAMASRTDEDDYMGDLSRFLQPRELLAAVSVSKNASSDGGVVRGVGWQGKRQLKRAQQQQVEDEHRSEGMSSSIPCTNIGFRMLQQMGYTPGNALGKHGQGCLEPVNVEIKRSRTGLGRDGVERAEKVLREKAKRLQVEMSRRKQEELKLSFQEKRRMSWQGRKIISDYHMARATLSQLEEIVGSVERETVLRHAKIEEKRVSEKEPQNAELQDHNEEDIKDTTEHTEEEITQEALQEVLEKLRSKFFYCLYCGCQYETAESLLENCPGFEEEDH
eukprot:c27666_g1_i1 orf=75-917(+)